MSELLLRTKFTIPVIRKDLVARPDLIEKLNTDFWQVDGFARKLTLVSAPAGFGKTTLVIDWLASQGVHAVWLSLDEHDNDPTRFMAYLIGALNQLDENIGLAALQMQQSPQPPPEETIITTLINDLAEISQPFILALDDYHVLQNPLIHHQVGFLLENQPEHMHLVILTREDPMLPISRLRSRGQVYEIRLDHLRFSLKETSEFIRMMGLDLAQDDINTLQRRTEGWVTGLQLAALSLRGFPHPQQFIQSFAGSNRYILDYLFEEIFSRLPSDIQDFLIRASILDQLTASLCDQVTGRSDSREQLDALERANLFIVPLDPAREWYRFHRLFRDLLRHHLNLRNDISVEALHQRASQWFEAEGDLEAAIQHALTACDWKAACRLIEKASEGMLKRGELATLIGWLRRIPAEVVSALPGLVITFAWALLLASQFDEAEPLLEQAEQLASPGSIFLGQVAAALAYLARARGDNQRLITNSQIALSLLPEDDWVARGNVALNLGLAYWHEGRLDEAEHTLYEAREISGRVSNTYAFLAAEVFLARTPASRGKLRQAEAMCQKILQNYDNIPILALANYDLSGIYYEWNLFDKAEKYLLRGLEISQRSGIREFQISGHIQRVFMALARGEPAGAVAAMDQADRLAREFSEATRSRTAACQVQLALALGDLDKAAYWTEQITEPADANSFFRFLDLTRPRLLIANGQKEAAIKQLEASFELASQAGWGYAVIAVRILQTLAATSVDQAVDYLADALRLGEPEGFIRTFADAGKQLKPLLHEAALRGIHSEYVGQILLAIREPDRSIGPDQTVLVEPLSERELEVLNLVAAGLSNREIAGKLFISAGTVKTHVHHICGKMGVRNRLEAATRAKELNLV
jgi:LuxR family maltose regulon positive regulatory protein